MSISWVTGMGPKITDKDLSRKQRRRHRERRRRPGGNRDRDCGETATGKECLDVLETGRDEE